MGVGERMFGGREGVTENGLGAAVTGSMFMQAESANVRIARRKINRFILAPGGFILQSFSNGERICCYYYDMEFVKVMLRITIIVVSL